MELSNDSSGPIEIRVLKILIIITLIGGTVMIIYCTAIAIIEGQARTLLEELNAQATKDRYLGTLRAWEHHVNLTNENLEKKMAAEAISANHARDAWEKVTKLPWRRFSNYSLKRQLSSYANLGTAALSEEKHLRLSKLISNMESIYATAKICPKDSNSDDSCTLSLDPDLTNILSTSKDPDELKHVWLKWRDAIGPKCRLLYKEYVDLSNEVAKLNHYKDMSEMLLGGYEDDTFADKVDSLWDQVKPLYIHLHAYIRTKLKDKYGDIVSEKGPIPAHLLGNMWGQSWTSVANFSLPYPDVEDDADLTERLKKKDYTVSTIFKTAEDFYKSINLTEMPDTFWSKSVLVKPTDVDMICHGSAWDFYHETDFRISMCTEITGPHFVTAHHEMGHVEYFLQYKDQPYPFRDGANDGFHEAMADLIALSAQSTKHLKKIGLYDNEGDPKALLNNLFRLGLFQVAFLPFAYLTDLWRWDVFSGRTTFKDYNCRWWALRHKYQGIEPPNRRSEKDFDPAAKYHIVAGVPYLRYFISMILQYQLHKALCEVAGEYEHNDPEKPLHECDIYENKKAGNLLKTMLAMGSSRPWPEALEVVTGQREMDASGILAYFQPLHDWLVKENAKNKAYIGWGTSEIGCTRN